MTEESPYKKQPDLERSGKMGTEENPSNLQGMPLRTWQYKCTKDGQTFSSQIELNNHYRSVHGMQAPDQQQQSGSSSYGDQLPSTPSEEMDNKKEVDAENKKSEGMGEEDEKENWGETSKEKNLSMKENEGASYQSGEYEKSSQDKIQSEYKCEKDGQVFSSQDELNQHNQKAHNMDFEENNAM